MIHQSILKQLAAKRQRNKEDRAAQKSGKKSSSSSSSSSSSKRPRNGAGATGERSLGYIEEKENASSFISKNYGVKVYDLEGKKSLQQILQNSKLKARYNEEAKNYTSLIDDLEFPVATNCIRLTADENHLWATGVYPPQVRCFVLDDLTMKFQRNCDSEVVKILVRISPSTICISIICVFVGLCVCALKKLEKANMNFCVSSVFFWRQNSP